MTIKEKLRQAKFMVLKGLGSRLIAMAAKPIMKERGCDTVSTYDRFGGLHVDAVISTKDPFISGVAMRNWITRQGKSHKNGSVKFSDKLHGCVVCKAQEIPIWTRNKPQSAHSGHTAQGQGSSTERR